MLKRVAEATAANMPGEESDLMKITPLGAGQEVGRSCHIIDFKVYKQVYKLLLHFLTTIIQIIRDIIYPNILQGARHPFILTSLLPISPTFPAVMWIHDILVWIRIRGSMPLTNGSGSYFLH
jgi:hypothetical protein